MPDSAVLQAVRNNADWCDAVCRAMDPTAGEFTEHLWLSRRPAPPYYPNIITLAPSSPALLLELEQAISSVRESLGTGFGIKDSYADLDLSSHEFGVLFEAQWHHRPATEGARTTDSDLDWRIVSTDDDLAEWKQAWDADVLATHPVFDAALLPDENIAFIAAYDGQHIAAGAIANRHAGALGISNLFTRPERIGPDWSAALAAASARFPGLPVVGYGPAAARPLVESLGFSAIGPLRVWTG